MSPPVLSRVSSRQGFSSVVSYKRAYLGRVTGVYQVSRSLRFNSPDLAYLSRIPATSSTDRKASTYSFWMKLDSKDSAGTQGSNTVLSCYDGSGPYALYWNFLSDANGRRLSLSMGGASDFGVTFSPSFRDPSAWYHIVIVLDTANATSTDRIRLYVNGARVTDTASALWPTQNYQPTTFISGQNTNIGVDFTTAYANYFNGLLADIHFIDGQAVTPSSFGQTDANGVWQPKAYTGTYGTNGFKLNFSDNSTAAALGTDTSGNNNTWSVNNFSVTQTVLYSSTITLGSGGGGTTGADNPKNAFDGSTSTSFGRGILQSATPNGGWSWNAAPYGFVAASSTAIRLYHCVRTGTRYYVNGSQVTPNFNGLVHPQSGWITLPTTNGAAITSISVNGTSDVAPQSCGEVSVIEINGTTLIDNSGAGNDSLVDSPTNYGTDTGAGGEVRGNYATFNPFHSGSGVTLSNGNLDASTGGLNVNRAAYSTIAFDASGKYYFEFTCQSANIACGIIRADSVATNAYCGETASGYGYYGPDGKKYNNNVGSAYGATFTTGDVIGVAIDSGTLTFYKNGVSQGAAYSGLSGQYLAGFGGYSNTISANFGQRPFAYPVSGFKALCTQNLPTPVVAQPSTVMDVKLYTGNGGTQTISGLGFSPDFVWIKSRTDAFSHRLQDTVRGVKKELNSDLTTAEYTYTVEQGLTAFNSDGFTLIDGAAANGAYNKNNSAFAAWCWDAGTTTVTNTQGSITSSVRANASAGFSIVTWTGNGTNGATVGHGLGATPGMVIVKSRSNAYEWPVYHSSLAAGNNLFLHLTNAQNSVSGTVLAGGVGAVSSTTFTCTQGTSNINNTNATSATYVAYCFAPVAGYSSAFSISGNGSSDGPFCFLGFRPRFIIYKRIDTAANWRILDTARDTYNVASAELYPNLANAEQSFAALDILSNGFKVRTIDVSYNASGGTYVGFAFAESPFQFARAR